MLRVDLYICVGGWTKMQGQLGSPLEGTSGASPHPQLCSLLVPEASVPSWPYWGLGGVAGCTVPKTGLLHRSGASWVVVEMLLLVTVVLVTMM